MKINRRVEEDTGDRREARRDEAEARQKARPPKRRVEDAMKCALERLRLGINLSQHGQKQEQPKRMHEEKTRQSNWSVEDATRRK